MTDSPLSPVDSLATRIYDRGVRLVLAVTGGGSGAISSLLQVPGASRSVLAAVVPYAAEALTEWLGGRPDEFCSSWTARSMAMQAFLKAGHYDPQGPRCGVACTASLASDRPKRGPHRVHLAFQDASTTATVSLELDKGARTRSQEEAVASDLLLNLIAEACGVTERLALGLRPGEHLEAARVDAPAEHQDLLAGRIQGLPLGAAVGAAPPRVVLPGAFRPAHQAHRALARYASQRLGAAAVYELSILNADKPPLDFMEIDVRLRQFTAAEGVWLTRAATFVEKSQLFPGATFVVGADTIARVGQARFYGGSESAMHAAIDGIATAGCRFLVFGRVVDGRFCVLDDLQLPPRLAAICQQVPPGDFRDDISSTELRRQAAE